jgi:hypothetical protein
VKALALLVLPLAACSSISVSTDFEGGNLGKIERVSESHFRCAVAGQADHEGRNRQASWYCFRLDGAKGREVTITLTDLRGEYNYKPGNLCVREDTPPVVSADGKSWHHLEQISLEKDEATFRVTPESDTLWIAHLEPYTASRLDRFLDEIRSTPFLKDAVIGKSVEGRALHLLTITEYSTISSSPSAPVVWLMCRQHAWETGTSFVGEGAVRYLLSEEARALRQQMVFKILPMMDPDGCAHGGVRFNRNGYDVNRNWDTADPENAESRRLMPEICAAKKAIGNKNLFLTLHNQETGEWLSGSEKHKEFADQFFSALRDKTTFNPMEKGPRTPGTKYAPGRASVYEYLESERGMRAFLLEQGITKSSKLGHLPTSKDRLEFGRLLIQVMADIAMGK